MGTMPGQHAAMPIWTIRRARPEDAAALTACIKAAYTRFAAVPDLPDVAQGITEDIAERLVWVAADGATIGGGLVMDVDGQVAHLMNLAVDPRHQGGGLARNLIAAAEKVARHNGCDRIDLATHVLMPQNRALYEHLGWVKTGQDGSKLLMTKRL